MTTQRLIAAVAAVPLVLVLVVVALLEPLPFATYSPGPTLDVLGTNAGREIVQVSGQKTYRDGGQLRMVTVSVSRPQTRQSLWELVGTWLDRSDAVYPYDAVYPDDETPEQSQQEGQVEMSTSQQSAEIAALDELGYDLQPQGYEVTSISPDSPADGALAEHDRFVAVGGTPITQPQDIVDAITKAGAGKPLVVTVLRDGTQQDVTVTPQEIDGAPKIGIAIGPSYDFPFAISVDVDPAIGGPSAGLMFSLAIYDTLTPGSLTDDGVVAGTGTIDADGTVGPIGGIQQKIVGARQAGAGIFLVPADNCADARGAHNGDMRLVKATTMHDARLSVEAWGKDHDATLPSCSGS